MTSYDVYSKSLNKEYKDIEIDSYLDNLKKELRNDNDIKSLSFNLEDNNINEFILRDQLSFFDFLNVKLHKVKVLFDDVEMTLNPKYIDIELDDKLRAHINYKLLMDGKLEPYYTKINIGKINSYYPKINYIHEIVHSQVNSYSNMNDEYNNELMPLFFELLYSDSINYTNRINDRLYELKTGLGFTYDKDQVMEIKTYTKSLLQALNLYRLYNRSSDKVKREIMGYINVLFNRDIYLEDLLGIYDINYDNSKKDLNVLKRSK